MHNPLRSEADAFRWFVIILGGAIVVGAVGTLAGPLPGFLLAALLIAAGAFVAYRASQGAMRRDVPLTRGGDGKHRVLVIANETVGGAVLLDQIRHRCQGRQCEIRIVTPALVESRAAHWASDVDEAIERARQRMELSVIEVEQLGLRAKGEIGDSEPNVALEDALRSFSADEILISTHPPERSVWLEKGVVERAREEIDLPITHVVVDLATEGVAAH
jgi:hypothetical protein